jgi:hypothetical protein
MNYRVYLEKGIAYDYRNGVIKTTAPIQIKSRSSSRYAVGQRLRINEKNSLAAMSFSLINKLGDCQNFSC